MFSSSEYRAFVEKEVRYNLQPWAHHGGDGVFACYYIDAPPEDEFSRQCSDNGTAKYLFTEVRWYGGSHNWPKARAENHTYEAYYPFCAVHCAEMRQWFETEGKPSERIAGYKVATL